MAPTLTEGTIVLGIKRKTPKVGDIVIATTQTAQEIIKRVKKINHCGYFLVGDNELESTDSRTLGYFSPSSMKAVVVVRVGYGS